MCVHTCRVMRLILIVPSCSSSDSDSGSVHSRGRTHGSRTVAKQRQWRQRMQWLQWQLSLTIAPHRCVTSVEFSFLFVVDDDVPFWLAGRPALFVRISAKLRSPNPWHKKSTHDQQQLAPWCTIAMVWHPPEIARGRSAVQSSDNFGSNVPSAGSLLHSPKSR